MTDRELMQMAYQATPHEVLIAEIMDCGVPKNEREHAAAREIQALRDRLAQPEHVHAIDISQERVDETAKREHDCNKCENRGRVLGDSQESYCENCIYGSPWKKDYYKEKNA